MNCRGKRDEKPTTMKKQVLQKLQLNIGERRGIIGFLCGSVLLVGGAFLLRSAEQPIAPDVQALDQKATAFFAQAETPTAVDIAQVALTTFDPNEASVQELQSVGMPAWLAQRIEKYRNSGGKFKQPSDLAKIYGMPPELFQRLEPFVAIAGDGGDDAPIYANKQAKTRIALTDFDPNKSTEAEFVALGLEERTARGILKYRDKGGRFKQADDFKKIYGVTSEQFEQLKPFIKIAMAEEAPVPATYSTAATKPAKPAVSIDINQASKEDWQKINGIGPHWANQIIWYREKMGGFSSVEMVAQTKNLPDSVFLKMKPFLKSSPITKQIAINDIIVDSLARHPMFGWKISKVVINYRTAHGNYKSINDLASADPAFTTQWLKSVEPYLKF
jgi:competence ComEA-like helix-hairpin-helix protein